MAPHSFRLLLAITILSHLSRAANIVSVGQENAFKAMRECARDCFAWNGSGDLIGLFGCKYPYQNECLCRTDLAPAASKHLTTCLDARCTVGPATGDIATAISVYNSYCVANGFEVTAAPAAAVAKTTSAAAAVPTKQGVPTAGQTVEDKTMSEPTGTQAGASADSTSTPKSGSGGGGLSTGAMIGIICSVASVVLTGIGLLIKVYYSKKKVKQNKELQQKLSSEKLTAV
ncbi:hypothetical protein QBC38DRAFT_487707 [Podospora fimiseda]|uniref:CFEM domain-containing protein n=1 Tax=Podospora fimiseda TaxID=252190 RepID=A0AAN7GUJ8_9PEZI|nr:hypothetical protein QBC38DRAFT_487707 [Podospora fimiseda]